MLAFFFIPMPHVREIHYLKIVLFSPDKKFKLSKNKMVRILSVRDIYRLKQNWPQKDGLRKLGVRNNLVEGSEENYIKTQRSKAEAWSVRGEGFDTGF